MGPQPARAHRAYCPFEKKDLTAEDYKRHNLPYMFDIEHTKCPNDGHELQVQQMTPMPSLRLTEDEARDIASYLMTRKRANATFADASFMDDKSLRNTGLSLVRNYGCAGCHEIAGLEEEQRIGTELTKEGRSRSSGWISRCWGMRRRRKTGTRTGILRAQAEGPGGLRSGQREGQTGSAEDAELQPVEARNRCGDDVPHRVGGRQRAGAIFLSAHGSAAGHHRRLVVVRKYNCMAATRCMSDRARCSRP